MDAYPPDYVQHNLPFIVLSGLETTEEREPPAPIQHVLPGQAITFISTEIPPVTGERAKQLLQEFLSVRGGDAPWNARGLNRRDNLIGFRIRTVGRNFKLPPKRAGNPPSSVDSPPASPTIAPVNSWTLHSPISPLSPVSPIFPDGVFVPGWIAKHQHYVPSVFLSFFTFSSDPNKNSLHDNQLKTEINKIKAQIQKSEYRTRYVAVLLSDKTVLEAPDVEERLSTIKRATGLDLKNSLFFLPPNVTSVELRSFVVTILTTLQPICVEYYRDLTKHARRKRGRSSIPPPTSASSRSTSRPLSTPGWNVRYDFKLGVFAEFRQEMDAALRHYQTALDSLFGSEGIFETTPSWSPRWDEIRLFADAIAIRHIRCLLWNHASTSAAQFWLRYKTRLKDLMDRRGKGSLTYSWEAWESRFAQIMAQIIQRAEVPAFRISHSSPDATYPVDATAFFAGPEKQIPLGEKLPPWEMLHHAGYWYKLAAVHAKRRLVMAQEIPEEDRVPPGMSPATKVANRNQVYDHYLVPEPHLELPLGGTVGGYEHWKDIVTKLGDAILEFEARGQLRQVEQLQLDVSKTLLRARKYIEAFKVLRPLWENMAWRREGWWNLASEVLWALHECALRIQDTETFVASEWELHSPVFAAKSAYKHDLMNCLNSMQQNEAPGEKLSITLNVRDFVSSLHVVFAFFEGEGNVGEPLQSQIAITSTARPGSAPITLSSLTFHLNGCLSEIGLTHDGQISPETRPRMYECVLDETIDPPRKPQWRGASNLTLYAGQTKVYSFPIIFREAGDMEVISSTFEITTDRFDLICTNDNFESGMRPAWWLYSSSQLKQRKLNRDFGTTVKVLPKPPKMEIRLPDLRHAHYVDELITVAIEVLNEEDEGTEAVIEVRLLGQSKDVLAYSWTGPDASSPTKEQTNSLTETAGVDLPGHASLARGARVIKRIQFKAPSEPSDYAIEVKVLYHVLSEREIPISKTLTSDLVFVFPFEASYDFIPRVHPEPWPSYFEAQEVGKGETDDEGPGSAQAGGIAQRWHLGVKIASFVEDTVIIKNISVETHSISGGAICNISNETDTGDVTMSPQDIHQCSFDLTTRKHDLDERRPTDLGLGLLVTWQRTASTVPVTTSIIIPHITIPSSEPRVLAAATHSSTTPLIYMDYILENPTMHFLTFELSMEASEEFGFSGAKLRNLHLLPMTRQTATYQIYPLVKGAWLSPGLKVVDRYFNQTLKIVATEGLRQDKKGASIWIKGDGE